MVFVEKKNRIASKVVLTCEKKRIEAQIKRVVK